MRSRSLRVLVLVVLVLASPAPAQGLTEAQGIAIDKICVRFDREHVPGVSVAITQKGKQVFAKGYGCAQLEHGVPIKTSTVFHVASVTKQFTAFALVLLAADGKLSLDDDVRKHVPWLHDFGRKITIRHLLNHTSGLRDQWELLMISGYRMDDVLTEAHILRILRHQRELNFAPGSRYLYCNMGYTLAAHIVEKVSGQSFEAFCDERIFGPLDMETSHMHVNHREIVPERAYSYGRHGLGWHKGVLSYANAGATSLFTTAPDLARWLQNLASAKVGGRSAIDALQRRGVLNDGKKIDYALGIMHGSHRGRTTLGHGGADAGFRSDVLWFPKEQLGVVVLGNVSDANPGGISRRIADVLLGEGKPEPRRERPRRRNRPAKKIDTEILQQYAGRYLCPELEVFYEIVVEGRRVFARQRRHGDIPLVPIDKDLCTGRSPFLREIRFTRNSDEVTGFRLSGKRVLNLKFVRVG